MTLAFIVLLNRCIDNHDETPKNWNINYDSHLQRRPREKVAQMLMLADCHPNTDTFKQFAKSRHALCRKF